MGFTLKTSHRGFKSIKGQGLGPKPDPEPVNGKSRLKGRCRSRINVLIACDELPRLKQMEKLLRRMKFCPLGIVTGLGALNHLRREDGKKGYDLMIVAMNSAQESASIISQAKEICPDLRVLAVSADRKEELDRAGAGSVLEKVPDYESFCQAIVYQIK